MTQIKEFVNDHFKSVMCIISFLMTMYIQHVNNINKINELSNKCSTLELKLDDQYKKHLSRYDLRYYPQYGKLLLEVSSFEFESDIEIHVIVNTLKEKNIHHLSINTYLNNYQLNLENLREDAFLGRELRSILKKSKVNSR